MARGRPRKVDLKDALQSVMIAFWQDGYSGTSMNDLAEVSGMAKPGLYAAFGDKETIFEKALLYYFETFGGPVFARLHAAQKHVIEDLRDLLRAVVDLTLDRNTPSGCFLVNAMIDCTYGAHRHREVVEGLQKSRFSAIKERLLKAVSAGEMPPDMDVDRAATFVDGQLLAIAVLARGGSTEADLLTFVETGLRALRVCGNPQVFEDAEPGDFILRQ